MVCPLSGAARACRTPLRAGAVAGVAALVAAGVALAGPAAPARAVDRPAPGGGVAGRPGPAGSAVGGAGLATTGTAVDPAAAPLPAVDAAGWLVADMDTGDVLAAHDPHGTYLPASSLKTLTALTLIPRIPPDTQITATQLDAGIDGSKVGLVPGQTYTARDLFTGMMTVSGNDAATALSEAAGGIPATTAAMQAEADRLGADDTHVVDPTGLDAPGQVSSAYDLALFARAGLGDPQFAAYVATQRARFPKPGGGSFEIDNHNPLLGRYAGTIGVKNGYTVAAQASYVGAARRDGHTLVLSLIRSKPDFTAQAKALLDWGFAADGRVTPVGQLVAPRTAVPPHAAAAAVTVAPRHASSGPPPVLWVAAAVTALAVWRIRRGRRRRRTR